MVFESNHENNQFVIERYICPINKIIIVITSGKAGYFVWKLAGGQGLHENILSEPSSFFFKWFTLSKLSFSVAKPLAINSFYKF